MKKIFTALFLIGLLIIGWGCRNAAVKTGSGQGKPAVESQSGTGQSAEQPAREASVSDGSENQEELYQQAEAGEVGKEKTVEVAEAETPVLNIDEEEEADSIYTVIETLEDCYRTRNYDRWLSLLTHAYRDHFDDPNTLASEGWDATNIMEFFDLLVSTRRRGNVRDLEISRVEFVSDYKAFVYVILRGEEFPEPQHTFIRMGETWYKGLSTEEV